jgi:hypothetical protein
METENAQKRGSAAWRVLVVADDNMGMVARPQALAAGVTRREFDGLVDRGQLRPFLPGIFTIAGAPMTLRQKLLGACLWALGHASHRSAAHLLELPGGSGDLIEVSTSRPVTHQGIIVHRRAPLPHCDRTEVDGVPITAPHRTILDLGAVSSEATVEAAVDEARRRGLITFAQLRWHLAAAGKRGVRGTAKLRRILDARGEDKGRRESVLETLAGRLFRNSPLPMPMLQFPIFRAREFLGRCDFAYPDLKISIEVLGWKWHYGKRQWELDLRRRTYLVAEGWIVLEFTWDDVVKRPQYVIETIRDAIKQRSFLLQAPSRGIEEKRTG